METWRFPQRVIAIAILAVTALSSAAMASSTTAQVPDENAGAHHYSVSIDEIGQTFVSDQPFTGGYETTVTLSNGARRTIDLTPMMHSGMFVVRLADFAQGPGTYMGPNGTTVNGDPSKGMVLVKLRSVDYPRSAWKMVSPMQMALADGSVPDPTSARFVVSIYEIRKQDAFAQRFTDHYRKTVAMSDGSRHTIELTPVERNGKRVLRLDDNSRISWLDPNDTTIDGKLMVEVGDMDQLFALAKHMRDAPAK